MVKFVSSHQADDEAGPVELVGSRDLRESFSDRATVEGSFSLNGYEFRNFQASSPAGIIAGINGGSPMSGVVASIDDQGHLVLLNSSADDILIGLGAVYEAPKQLGASVAEDVVNRLKAEAGAHEVRRNTILDDLGLEATPVNDLRQEAALRPGFETGLSAEERRKEREAAGFPGGAATVGGDSPGV